MCASATVWLIDVLIVFNNNGALWTDDLIHQRVIKHSLHKLKDCAAVMKMSCLGALKLIDMLTFPLLISLSGQSRRFSLQLVKDNQS